MQVYNNTRVAKKQAKMGFFSTVQSIANKFDKKKIEEEKIKVKQQEDQKQKEQIVIDEKQK